MVLEIPKIKDIMTTDLLYYSEELEEQCKEMCQNYNISYLPDLESDEHYYKLDNDGFKQEELKAEQKVDWNTSIFDKSVLEKFQNTDKKHEVLFVFDASKLVGVVHICDYNHSNVQLFLFKYLLDFEQSLRQFLFEKHSSNKELINEKMLEYLKNEKGEKSKQYKDFMKQQKVLSYLQGTYLFDLMEFAIKNKYKIENHSKINKLRRKIAHSNDFVERAENLFTYNISTLKDFFEEFGVFQKEYKRLQNHLNFQ